MLVWLLLALIGTTAAAEWTDIGEPLRTGEQAPRDAAVVIGNEDYVDLPDVPFASNDAAAFKNFLLYTRGVAPERVQTLNNASPGQMRRAVERAAAHVDGGVLWVYYAGHGAAHPVTRERVLLGRGARLDPDPVLFEEGVVALDALKGLTASVRGEVIFIVDACYTGTGRDGVALGDSRFAVPPDYPPASEVTEWTATQPDQVASPLDGADHGAFTYFVVGALRGWADGELTGAKDGVVVLDEARAYVERALQAVERLDQTPVALGTFSGVLSRSAQEPAPDLRGLVVGEPAAVDRLTQQLNTLASSQDALARLERETLTQAGSDWAQVLAMVDAGGGFGEQALALFIDNYTGVVLERGGQRIALEVPQVTEARVLLERLNGPDVWRGMAGYEMVKLPAGSFWMGSVEEEEGRNDDEALHEVQISEAFWMGATEVTQALWERVMGENPSKEVIDGLPLIGGTLPVQSVSWMDAVAFANRLSELEGLEPAYVVRGKRVTWERDASGYRLPTEAEWEYAARAGGEGAWTATDQAEAICRYGNFADASVVDRYDWAYDGCSDGRAGPAPVGSYEPNAWGLYDTSGNVWEWVWDSYQAGYERLKGPDPANLRHTSERVYKGGSWNGRVSSVRVAMRGKHDYQYVHWHIIGLRLARSL